MAQCLIIADDLTGANATGVLLQKIHYSSFTVIDSEHFEKTVQNECDCIICPTNSRALDSEVAYEKVYITARMMMSAETQIYCKRIDSTLRGNLGCETDALLDALGESYTAFAVPSFPQSGRIVCGGYMLVNGVPLHKTEAAIDPKTPVSSSSVQKLFTQQSKYPVNSLTIDDLQRGKAHLISAIQKAVQNGVRIITFDCISQEDLDLIAESGIESGIPFICADPGPFSATVVRKKIIPKERKKNMKILAVVGSVNPVARLQVEELFLSQHAVSVCIKTKELITDSEKRAREVERVVQELCAAYTNSSVCCIYGDGLFPENKVDFSEYVQENTNDTIDSLSLTLAETFAEITFRVLQKAPYFTGIYTSGGDITAAVCKRFHAAGIKLLGEVLPLAAFGELIGGTYHGLTIVTKGGMAGDREAMKKCIQYMQERLLL